MKRLADRLKSLPPASQRLLLVCYFGLLFIMRLAYQRWHYGNPLLDDDAYYYLIIARNIAQHGISSFDGQSLTNGYHPLWLAMLIVQYGLSGDAIAVTLCMELGLLLGALYLLLALLDQEDLMLNGMFGAAFFWIMGHMAPKGMEVSAWVFCFSLLLHLSRGKNAAVLGICAAFCIFARIDSIVFIVPFIWFALPGLRARLLGFAPVIALAGAYAAWSQITFGMPFPISGAVKSLGGFQLNHALIREYIAMLSARHISPPTYCLMLAGFCATPFLLPYTAPHSTARLLLLTYLVGFTLYGAKLLLFSSWVIWEWYGYPFILFATGVFFLINPILAQALESHGPWRRRMNVLTLTVLPAGLLAIPIMAVMLPRGPTFFNFLPVNKMAAEKFMPALKGARIAMGDRAGSFAYFYPGPVTQLEGLVGDKEYLRMLETQGDLRALLCRRGVKYIAAYAEDLGNYTDYEVESTRAFLTQNPGPRLHVTHAQEIGHVSDLNIYDGSASGQMDNTLYIWRMDCGF